ncbi:hypothetical protein TNCV_3563101 [Trichonephila clavipes]|nr:hypothetical protein TNCV_3563101 [Trichonephila clavipes]
MSFKIPTITKSSNSTQAHLLSESSVAATLSESPPPVPLAISTPSSSNSLCTSTKSTETHPSALEFTTSISNSIPSTITHTFPISHTSKRNLKSREKSEILKLYVTLEHPPLNQKLKLNLHPINREKVHLFKTPTMKT